jgi:parvulin-like peptidyl-prolyl isomerase
MIHTLNTGIIQTMKRTLFYCKVRLWFRLLWAGLLALALTSCNRTGQIPTPATLAGTIPVMTSTTPVPQTPSSEPPTASPEPLAAQVNGEGISLAEYQAEQALYRAGSGKELTPEDQKRALDDLIDQTMLAQAASEQGFVADTIMLDERMQKLAAQLGSEQALNTWLTTYGYTPESFRRTLSRAVRAAWMRDQIAAATPKNAEQVHIRQILLYNVDEANQVLAQLQAGNDFGNLAAQYDPVAKGDLGWFPRGYLPDKKLEDAAFNLQEKQNSTIIETLAGYHILQLIERDPQHSLSPDALLVLQNQAVRNWLEQQRSQSDIQILTP